MLYLLRQRLKLIKSGSFIKNVRNLTRSPHRDITWCNTNDLSTTVKILLDLDEHYITREEIIELAEVISESFPDPGTFVASFGFLTYKVIRGHEACVIEVTDGYGMYSAWGGIDTYQC